MCQTSIRGAGSGTFRSIECFGTFLTQLYAFRFACTEGGHIIIIHLFFFSGVSQRHRFFKKLKVKEECLGTALVYICMCRHSNQVPR